MISLVQVASRRLRRVPFCAQSQWPSACRYGWMRTCATEAVPTLDQPAKLSVWSFNLRTEFCEERDGADGWRYRAGGCASLIKRHSPAVLCVQEATKPMLDSLCGRLGYQWHGKCRSGTGEDEHSALVWDPARVRLLRGETRWLSSTPDVQSIGWDAQYPRIYTRGLFELVGCGAETVSSKAATPTRLALVSTHLDHVGHNARLHSASLLRSAMDVDEADEWQRAVGQPGVPTILCGDFNSVKSAEDGSAYHTLTSAVGACGGFEDAWVLCPADGRSWNGLAEDGSTIHKFEGLDFVEAKGDGTVDLRFQSSAESAEVAARRTGGSSRHIDWVLVHHPEGCGTQLTVGTAAVITDQVESLSAGRRTKRYPSDHFPVAVEFWVHSKN